ncbi:MAG: glycoside hydrolase family 2 TIM barrel-domain containing protein [Armatimonadota bacterium]|nr:glycoside hydrolase family 2 TIM barrel-domain containing protein [Armatimonadota bacterium]
MKQTLSLNGTWRLVGADPGSLDLRDDSQIPPSGAVVVDAQVPGEVHVDLHRAGLIPDPFYGMNAREVQWIEEKEWWYTRTFEVEKEFLRSMTFLEFEGLDMFASVFLNGKEIGRAGNMFIPHRFDVTEYIREGENFLAVKFEPTSRVLAGMDHNGLFGCFDTPRVNARKMQCAFGWDWTHRFVGAGIWRDARLVSEDRLAIRDVHVEPELEGDSASIWISVELANHTGRALDAELHVVISLSEEIERIQLTETIPPDGDVVEILATLDQPQLWWPNGFGEQPVYRCMVGVRHEDEVQDAAETTFGIRTVGFVEHDIDGSNRLTLLVNGEEVFCKGANWVPADHFVSRVSRDRYRKLVSLAKDAGFNMLRVWGGGIYEDSEFYKACDEMGILVWQDFMFACASYPDRDDFAAQVSDEVETVVKRLRNHPCVVVWCGNNECEMNYSPEDSWPGKRLFYEVIPNALKRLDHSRPYRPSTPYGGKVGNDPSQGTWHGGSWFRTYLGDHRKWRHYIEEDRAPFVCEFYAQGSPQIESLKEFIPEDQLYPPTGECWEFHNKDNPYSGRTDGLTHQQILVDLTRRLMGDFKSAEEFAAYSGILQGEFVKAEIEHFRREKWAISGALYWMFDDCWPAVGWSLVDYYLRPKPAYYYAKRACAPVLVSFKQLDQTVQVYVTSDNRDEDVNGVLRVGVLDFETSELRLQEVSVNLPANQSAPFWESKNLLEVFSDPARQCLVAVLETKGQLVARNFYFPLPFAEMQFPKPRLLVQREQVDEKRHKMTIAPNGFARNVAISNLPAEARPSDNYFDLLPGEAYEVTIDNLTVEGANRLAIQVWGR